VDEYEAIPRAYFLEDKSVRAIAREYRHGRPLVRRAIASAEPTKYTLKQSRSAPVLGSYKARIDELLAENETLPRKQRYTSRKIFELIAAEGYQGSASSVRAYIAAQREELRVKPTYLPLEFEPGQDAQMDWGEAVVEIAGQLVTVQFFVMRRSHYLFESVYCTPGRGNQKGGVESFDPRYYLPLLAQRPRCLPRGGQQPHHTHCNSYGGKMGTNSASMRSINASAF